MTPEEAWNGRKSVADHFRIFGCIAYAHIPDEKRKKLDAKGEKCVFLGVSENSKAYKLLNPLNKKILISREVIFDENDQWDWTKNGPNQQQVPTSLEEDEDDDKSEAQVQSSNEDQVITSHIQAGTENEPRLRKRLAWMRDYVSGDDLSDDDQIAHIALFADCDPITFQ